VTGGEVEKIFEIREIDRGSVFAEDTPWKARIVEARPIIGGGAELRRGSLPGLGITANGSINGMTWGVRIGFSLGFRGESSHRQNGLQKVTDHRSKRHLRL
jgi:hypothetical protein